MTRPEAEQPDAGFWSDLTAEPWGLDSGEWMH
ncbi:hypothetical protein FHU30_000531 [Actinomadura rupiterrae]|nr:hypothetical protein [Actinomadura rupiterrae]